MTPNKTLAMSAQDLEQTLERLTDEIMASHPNRDQLVLVGIRTGGAFLAQRLAAAISRRGPQPVRVGVLDITLYRDDWTQLSHKPLVGKTELPGSIDDQVVVLVDDVLFTGRTIRAALDALIDYGRPRRIELAVLVDRGGRELPIQPDYVGRAGELPPGQRVNVYLTEMGRSDEVAIELGPPGQVLMGRQQNGRGRGGAAQPDLAPEAKDRLAGQVAAVAAALAKGAGPDRLKDLITPDPQDPLWDEQLIGALGTLNHPAIPALLAAAFAGGLDKARRKSLNKALHRLKTRGVPVPDDLLPREAASLGAPRPGTAAVFISPQFSDGQSYVILEGPAEVLRGNFLVARLSDTQGFQECVLLNLKRQQLKEFWDKFREQGLDDWVSPPPAYAVRFLEETAAAHPDAEGGTSHYLALREKIFQHWGRPESAPDLEKTLPEVADGDRKRIIELSPRLALDPWFHGWRPGPEEIEPWLDRIQAVEASPLVLSEAQKQVRVDAVLDETTLALYPRESRADWRRRLMAAAYYLHLKGRSEDAAAARAAAEDLGDEDSRVLRGENPFLKGLVQYALHLALGVRQPPEPAAPPGLVVTPGDPRLFRR